MVVNEEDYNKKKINLSYRFDTDFLCHSILFIVLQKLHSKYINATERLSVVGSKVYLKIET